MLTLEEMARRLRDRRPSIVCAETGVHVNTIRAIRDGVRVNPTYTTLKALSDYLEANQ